MTAVPALRGHRRRREGGFRFTPARVGVFALLLMACAGMIWSEKGFRTLEASVAGWWLDFVVPPVSSSGPVYMVPIADTGAFLLRVTPECSVVLLIVPILLVLSFFSLHAGTSLLRVVLAAAVTASGLFLVNQVRLGVIAVATNIWGMNPGYQLSHVLVGSVVGIVGFVAALLSALAIMGVRRTRS